MRVVIAVLFLREIVLYSMAAAFLYTIIGLARTRQTAILSEKCFISTSHGNNDAFESRSLILCFEKDKELHNLRI
jgi:hypothetical protein